MLEVLLDNCDGDEDEPDPCSHRSHVFTSILHSDKDGIVDNRQGVEVSVASALIPPEHHEEVRTALIEQIADTFMIAGGIEGKNCYRFDRKSSKCLFCNTSAFFCPLEKGLERVVNWCNAPSFVKVRVVDSGGKEIAHMQVDLEFQGKTWMGKFDCVSTIEAVERNARENRVGRLKDAVGGKEVETVVTCSSNEVTGSCPNDRCTYELGSCFPKSGRR